MKLRRSDQEVRTYVAECFRVGVSEGDLSEMAARAEHAAAEMTATGRPVRYVGSVLMPEDEVVFLQFEATSSEDVADATRKAQIAFERVIEAVNTAARPALDENKGHGAGREVIDGPAGGGNQSSTWEVP